MYQKYHLKLMRVIQAATFERRFVGYEKKRIIAVVKTVYFDTFHCMIILHITNRQNAEI